MAIHSKPHHSLFIVVRTDDNDDQVGCIVIELRQIDAEIGAGELGFVVLVVEDRRLAEALRENVGDLGDEVPLFPGKGEGDAEAFGTHPQQTSPFVSSLQ